MSYWKSCQAAECPCPNHLLATHSLGAPDSFNGDPTFHHLTQTNNTPLSSEITAISSMVAELEGTMSDLEVSAGQLKSHRAACKAHLSVIETQLNILEVERAKLSLAINERKVVLSSVRRLPPEVLQHIFMDTIDFPAPVTPLADKGFDEWYDLEEGDNTLWTIELVCQRWRAALLADSSLWSFIDIIVSTPNFDERNPRYITRLATQLERVQLSFISLCVRRCASFTLNNLPKEISLLLLPYANRIHELHLFIPLTSLISGLSLLRHRLSHLTLLSLINTPFVETSGESIDTFTECPRLTILRTTDIVAPGSLISIPWGNLKEIHAGHTDDSYFSTNPSEWRFLLTEAMNLQKCWLELSLPDDPPVAPLPLTCRNLVSLTILCHAQSCDEDHIQHPIQDLFCQLTLPSLALLRILFDDDNEKYIIEDSDVFTFVVDLIERSHCPLSTLEFPDGNIQPNDLVRFFRVTPTIEIVKLMYVGNTYPVVLADVFRTLTPKSSTDIVAPSLHTLHIYGNLQLKATEFLEMIQSRWSRAPFKQIDVAPSFDEIAVVDEMNAELAILKVGLEEYCDKDGLDFFGEAVQNAGHDEEEYDSE